MSSLPFWSLGLHWTYAGLQQYQDSVAGVSVYITESWVVTGVVPSQSAILQSLKEKIELC
jgi:hypothetical protein